MKTKYLSWIITAVILAVFFVLGACVMVVPVASNNMDGFSAVNASKYLEVISSKPHSVFDFEAHEEVRLYIKNTLTDMGLTVEEHTWLKEDLDYMGDLASDGTLDKTKPIPYDINNLWVKIAGKSDTGVLLMAHYDSRGHASRAGEVGGSFGAADDGFGVVTMMEIARVYSQIPQAELENSIYICFTDAEETGMYGSELEAKHNEVIKNNVNFVINLEARGVRGPAFMFETSKNNAKVMELYSKAGMPVTYSVATAVYSVMPNFTDFTAMLEIGKAGINFSTLDNINYYHVPADNFDNIDVNSLQHYGSQVMPILQEYTSNSKYSNMDYFEATQDSVFFNILPGVLLSYTEIFAIILAVVTLCVYGVAVFFGITKGKLNVKRLLIAFGIVLGIIIASAIVGFVISYLTALFAGQPWNLTYLRAPASGVPFALSLLIVLGLVVFFAIKRYGKKPQHMAEYLTASSGIGVFFGFVLTFVLSGASFIFIWSALFASIALLVKNFTDNSIALFVLYSLGNVITLLIYVPLVYALFLAVTVGGLLALNLLFAVALCFVVPTVFLQGNLTLCKKCKTDTAKSQAVVA